MPVQLNIKQHSTLRISFGPSPCQKSLPLSNNPTPSNHPHPHHAPNLPPKSAPTNHPRLPPNLALWVLSCISRGGVDGAAGCRGWLPFARQAEGDGHWVKEPEGFCNILRFLEV
jgi:hypothetical protein